jgi:hypothetical protein
VPSGGAVHSINSGHPVAAQYPPLWADCVAKVESCRATNFRENPKREEIADSYNLNRATEVAYEFNVSR